MGSIVGALAGAIGNTVTQLRVSEAELAALPELLQSDPEEAAKIIDKIGEAEALSFLVSAAFWGVTPLGKSAFSASDALVGAAAGKAAEKLFE